MGRFMNTVSLKEHSLREWSAALLCLLGLSACSREPAAELTEFVRLDLNAAVTANAYSGTRAAVDGTYFRGQHRFGMWVCESGTEFRPVMDGYMNLLATLNAQNKDSQVWQYTFDGLQHDIMHVKRFTPADIYAYYPFTGNSWPNDTFNPLAVPFRSGTSDWMWAEPVTLGEELLHGDRVDVPLEFHHAMTCIEVRIKCLYTGTVDLTEMSLTDSKGRLIKSGTMNILTGELSFGEENKAGRLTITYSVNESRLTTQERRFHIIMPAVSGYEDGDFELSFKFDNLPAKTSFSIPGNIIDQDGNDIKITGFETGKRYIYSLTLDNMLRFVPKGVTDDWKDEEFELIM